jgi:hypothetical protein
MNRKTAMTMAPQIKPEKRKKRMKMKNSRKNSRNRFLPFDGKRQ